MSIEDRIRMTRRRAGLTQEEFAGKIGTSQKVISRWEKGIVKPRDRMIEKIAKAGRVTYEWLASGEGAVDDPAKLSGQERRLLQASRDVEDLRVTYEMVARMELGPALASGLSGLDRRIEMVFYEEDLEHRFLIEQALRRRFKTLYEELVFQEGEYQKLKEESDFSYIVPNSLENTEQRRKATRERIEKLRLFDKELAIGEIKTLESDSLPLRELLDHLTK